MPNNSLRPIREKKGLTVAQLAGRTSISIRTLQMYETGERPISADDLRKLSRVLFTPTTELLQPSADPPPPPPPPAPPPRPEPAVEPPPAQPAAETPFASRPETVEPRPSPELGRTDGEVRPTGPGEFIRRPFPPSARGEYRRPFGAPTTPRPAPMPRPARQPRESRAARAPGPATKGQLDQIHNLARRMGLAEAEVEERVGAPLNSLDHLSARGAISKLRQQLEESGTWQPRVGEGTDQEGAYLGKLRDCGVELVAHLINGQRVEGTIVDFTPYTVRLRGGDGDEVTVRKLAIAYYQTKGPVDDAQ